jgi:hypothetical protein
MEDTYSFLPVQTYLEISALLAEIDSNLAFYLLAISNAGSGVGRFVCSYSAHKIGMCHSNNNYERLNNSRVYQAL